MNVELLGMLAAHVALTGLPGAAAVLVALRRGLRDVPLLLAVALAVSGSAALLSFWLFYAAPAVGKAAAIAVVAASVAGIGLTLRRGIERAALKPLAAPVALWLLASAFVLFLGFVHGGTADPLATAATRFSHPLPGDNLIPLHFAQYFYANGHQGTPPPFFDWLSSDRPPLQIGYELSQRAFGWGDGALHYQVLGIVVQQLWVIGLWALLVAVRLTPRTRGIVAVAAIVSDFAIVHGFFVWPKLIAAAFLLAALAMVLSEGWATLRRKPLAAVLFATLCALAMLAHGSSVFFVLPLLAVAAARGMPGLAWIATAAAVGVVLLGSWSAYQRYGDPPGDRLVKWQIGGFVPIDERGTAETIIASYRGEGVGGTLSNKWDNLTAIGGRGGTEDAVRAIVDDVSAGRYGAAIAAARSPRFYSLVPALGLLLIGPLAMLIARLRGRRDGPDWRFAVTAGAVCALACAVWALLMFGGPDSAAIIHQGSLAVPLLAVAVCVSAACAVDARLGAALVAANAALVLALYVPAVAPASGSGYSAFAALLAAAALAGILWIGLRPAVSAASASRRAGRADARPGAGARAQAP